MLSPELLPRRTLLAGLAGLLSAACNDGGVELLPACDQSPATDSTLPPCDAGQLNNNAATSVLTTSTSSFTLGHSSAGTIASLTVGPYPVATSVVITVTGAWSMTVGSSSDIPQVWEDISTIPPATSQTYKNVYNAPGLLAASADPAGTYADEETFALAANTTTTYYHNGYMTGLSTTSATMTNVTMKAEVVKR